MPIVLACSRSQANWQIVQGLVVAGSMRQGVGDPQTYGGNERLSTAAVCEHMCV
jgi:hypothetical protein